MCIFYLHSCRYHDHWKFVIQRLSFLCSFYVYIQTKKLATRNDVATMLEGLLTGISFLTEENVLTLFILQYLFLH